MTIKPRTIFLTTFGAVLALTGALLMDLTTMANLSGAMLVLGAGAVLVGIFSHVE